MGGGIRTIDDANYLLNMGVDKIILGTLAIENPSTVKELASEFGSERIIVALDSKDSQVVVRGWTEKTAQKAPVLGKSWQNMELEAYYLPMLIAKACWADLKLIPF